MTIYKSIICATALALTPAIASATVITFEESPQASGAVPSTQADIISGGYVFDSSTNHTHLVNNYSGGDSGSTFFSADDFAGSNTVTMSKDGGGIFDLFSLDLGNWFETSSNLLLTGNLSGGGVVSTNIALGAFATFQLNWSNLSSVVFDSTAGTGDQYWGVDNINLEGGSVPAPASLALVGLGLFGIRFACQRRNSQPV